MLLIITASLGLVVINQSGVQNKIIKKVLDPINNKTSYSVTFDEASISWTDHLSLQDMHIKNRLGESIISTEELKVSFSLQNIWSENKITLSHLELLNPVFNMGFDKGDTLDNITAFIKAAKAAYKGKKKSSKKQAIVFQVNDIEVINGTFNYFDSRKEKISDRFDYNHFVLDSIGIEAKDLLVDYDTISLGITSLIAEEDYSKEELGITETFFKYDPQQILLSDLDLKFADSRLKDHLQMEFESTSAFNDFINDVELKIHFENSIINSDDIAYFAPEITDINDKWMLDGIFSGTISRFYLNDFKGEFGRRSSFEGDLRMTGLPNFFETFMDLDIENARLVASDLDNYLSKNQMEYFNKLGKLNLEARFTGFPKDFVTNGVISSELGTFSADLNLKIKENENNSYYKGKVRSDKFAIGEFLDAEDILGNMAIDGSIEGQGFSLNSAQLSTKSRFKYFELINDTLHNINVNAFLKKGIFDGKVEVLDSAFKVYAQGSLDLNHKPEKVDINVETENFDLYSIGLTKKSVKISTEAEINFTSLDPNKIVGDLSLKKLKVMDAYQKLYTDSIIAYTHVDSSGHRVTEITSDLLHAKVDGDYSFDKVATILQDNVNEYMLALENNKKASKNYYAKKAEPWANQNFKYSIELRKINPLLKLVDSTLYITPRSSFSGSFSSGEFTQLRLFGAIDSFHYRKNHFHNMELSVSSSKNYKKDDFLSFISFSSDSQNVESLFPSKKMSLEAVWGGRTINFTAQAYDKKDRYGGEIDAVLKLKDTAYSLELLPSFIRIFEDEWHIQRTNEIVMSARSIEVDSLQFYSEGQNLFVDGTISENPKDDLLVNIKDFDLITLKPVTGITFRGITNGYIKINDFYNNLEVNSEIDIKDTKVDTVLIGDVKSSTYWDASEKNIKLIIDVIRENKSLLTAYGAVDVENEGQQLDISANFSKTPAKIIEPFLSESVSDITGTMTGQIDVKGKLMNPEFHGYVDLEAFYFTINYLNVRYHANEKMSIDNKTISFRNAKIYDQYKNSATISYAAVNLTQLSNPDIELKANFNKFILLNTEKENNDIYYGSAIATGDIDVTGTLNDLYIGINATSEKGTHVSIPLDEDETLEDKEFIEFVDRSAQNKVSPKEKLARKLDLSGITMDIKFDVTDDAYLEIIFDEQAGDIFRAVGNGKISLQIDTRGEFNIYGDYEIQEGAYNFTFLNLINKRFDVLPGSRMYWTGNPMNGQMDVTAAYTQNVQITPIIDPIILEEDSLLTSRPELNQRYPTTLFLYLDGKLLSPEISFDIDIDDYPQNVGGFSLENQVRAFKNRIENNEQAMNQQALSLIVFNKLSQQGNAFQGYSGGSSVSELLSNQLSFWVSQVDDNLEINIDLNGLDADALNALQLRLSYTFLDGRLRVTREGGFTDVENTASASSIAGEWTVEYKIDKRGRFRIKVYNRNNQTAVATGIGSPVTTGASFLHTESFDNLSELLRLKREEEKQKEQKPIQ